MLPLTVTCPRPPAVLDIAYSLFADLDPQHRGLLNLAANARWNRSSPMGSAEDLGYALTLNTDLKALVVHGYHDLSTPYFMSRYLLEQSVYGDNARQRLSFGVYPGGHMFYLNPASRAELFKDVAAFYR